MGLGTGLDRASEAVATPLAMPFRGRWAAFSALRTLEIDLPRAQSGHDRPLGTGLESTRRIAPNDRYLVPNLNRPKPPPSRKRLIGARTY